MCLLLERDIKTCIDHIVVLSYIYNGVGIIDEAIGTTDTDRRRNVVLEVDGSSEARFLEIRLGSALMNRRSRELPMLPDLIAQTKGKVALQMIAISILCPRKSSIRMLPLFVLIEEPCSSKHQCAGGIH